MSSGRKKRKSCQGEREEAEGKQNNNTLPAEPVIVTAAICTTRAAITIYIVQCVLTTAASCVGCCGLLVMSFPVVLDTVFCVACSGVVVPFPMVLDKILEFMQPIFLILNLVVGGGVERVLMSLVKFRGIVAL